MIYSLMYGLHAAGQEDFETAAEALGRWREIEVDGGKWGHVIDENGRELTQHALELLAEKGL